MGSPVRFVGLEKPPPQVGVGALFISAIILGKQSQNKKVSLFPAQISGVIFPQQPLSIVPPLSLFTSNTALPVTFF